MKKVLILFAAAILSAASCAQGQLAALIHQNVNVFESGSLLWN